MALRRLQQFIVSIAAAALWVVPSAAHAQECVGNEPRGGRYVTSAELYIETARGKKPEDMRRLYGQARDVLEEGFERQPDNPRNYEMAGVVYAKLKDYERADWAFTKAEEMWSCYTATIDTLRYREWTNVFNTAVGYHQSGDLETAATWYNDAWTIYDKLPQSKLQLGGIYANMSLSAETEEERKQYQDQAIDALQTALDLLASVPEVVPGAPNEANRSEYSRAAAFNLAQLLAFEERFEEAAATYGTYLEMDPGNVDAMSNAAVVLVRASNQAALQAGELDDGPDKDALLANAEKWQEEANELYRELLAREDLDATEYHNIGLGLMQIGLHDEAAIAFTKAMELEMYRSNSLEQLARAYFQGGLFDSLTVVATKLVERYPLSLDNLALLANAYRETEMLDDALAALERREALTAELTDLDLESEEGVYTVSGYVYNIGMEEGAQLELQFDFYDDVGEIVASEMVSLTLPAQDQQVDFEVSTESASLISGFTYKPAGASTSETETQ